MKARGTRRQRGAALIALVAMIVLGTSWMLVTAYGNASNRTAQQRAHNGRVLAEAKAALVAWIAINAFESTENNPGRLPCPQYWGDVGSSNEGRAGGSCISSSEPTQPAAGWLPWRTLGLSKLTDASGTQLWYVVSPGWASRTDSATLTINSNSLGQLTVDGQANAAVALIIAPGSAIGELPNSNQISAGCSTQAQNQTLNLPTTEPSTANFLDCQNGSTIDGIFVTSVVDNATRTVFNDQVMIVTTADILPTLEAMIAKRTERDIVPALKSVYASSQWRSDIGVTSPLFPYPAPFDDPSTSNYQGTGTFTGAPQGLLPFFLTQGCTPATDARCTTSYLAFSKSGSDVQNAGSGSIRTQSTCSWQADVYVCTGEYNSPSISLTLNLKVTNVAMGLRTLDLTKVTCTAVDDVGAGAPTQTVACTSSVALQPNGSALITVITSAMPDIDASLWGTYANYKISIDRAVFGDHALLSSTATATGWFVRNEWYRLLYYAVAPGYTAATAVGSLSCSDSGTITCLQVTNLADPAKQRAVLALTGRSLSTLSQTRPSSSLQNHLDSDENRNLDSNFVQSAVGRSFNDRFISVSKNL